MTNTEKVVGVKTQAKPKRKKAASLDRRKARAGWVFVMPFVIGLLLIYLPVMFDSIQFSFSQLNNLQGGGYTLTFIGFENYQKALFEDASFVQVLVSGLQSLAFEIPAIVIFSLFMAVLLNQKMIGRGAFRAIFFIPVIISTGIMEGIATYDQSMDSGINDGSGESATEGIVNAMDIQMLFANMKVGTAC